MNGLFEELADNAPVMIWRASPDRLYNFFNKPWLDFTGRTKDAEFGKGWMESLHPEDFDKCLSVYENAFDARETFSMEYRLRRRDGEYRWLVDNGAPFYQEGAFAGYMGSCVDITARKEYEDGRLILIAELNHRVKNMLSTVQSLARQSCARAGTPREAEELLSGRLMALSQAHEILAEERWQGGDINQIVRRVSALATRDAERVHVKGPSAFLPPEAAHSLTLALYELFLTAMQHGALSSEAGLVDLGWTLVDRRGRTWLDIAWQEQGGPPVETPETQGLGTRLIRSMLPAEIHGETIIEFPNDGVVCHIRFPVDRGIR